MLSACNKLAAQDEEVPHTSEHLGYPVQKLVDLPAEKTLHGEARSPGSSAVRQVFASICACASLTNVTPLELPGPEVTAACVAASNYVSTLYHSTILLQTSRKQSW